MKKGYLTLENGEVFEGVLIGDVPEGKGEVVFNTNMTGYQEIVSDPSYAGQIVTFCYPLIGNVGINLLDNESRALSLAGVVVSDLCTAPSHYQSVKTFADYLAQFGVPCLAEVDTRALVKKVRVHGTMKGVIADRPADRAAFFQDWDAPEDWVKCVSTKEIRRYDGSGPHVVLIDYGYKKSILDALLQAGCRVTVVPYDTPFETIRVLKPNGIVFSNGPGDPMVLKPWFPEIKRLAETYPALGICLGHQLIAAAHGAAIGKLLFGHRGGNHPVKDTETGKVWMTTQNHSYVVKEETVDERLFRITYKNVNDGSVEGLKHRHLPVETVQFHPEAHPGPRDAEHIFHRFINSMKYAGEVHHAVATRN